MIFFRQKPKISSINKRFLINTLKSARMSDTKISKNSRNKDPRNKDARNKDARNKEDSSFALRSLQRTSLHSKHRKRNFKDKKETIKEGRKYKNDCYSSSKTSTSKK